VTSFMAMSTKEKKRPRPLLETSENEIGYALGNWLFYATGGGALGQVETNAAAAVGSLVARGLLSLRDQIRHRRRW
jgi:hypothetical protein